MQKAFAVGQKVLVKRSSGEWTLAEVKEFWPHTEIVTVFWAEPSGKMVGKHARYWDVRPLSL